jgi:hypothetical protein
MAKTRMIHAPDTSRRNVSTPKRSAHLLARSWRKLAWSGSLCT